MRKLASVREIKEIRPIENADAIETAIVDGWECVVKKSENFKAGDKVVYIEIDSIVPERPEFEFLRERKFRVRTIKLRKQVSQGLVLPLNILPQGDYNLDDDVTDILGVRKYDPEGELEQQLITKEVKKVKNPIIKFMLKFKWFRKLYLPKKEFKGFPTWIVKTDEERIQNKTRMFEIEKELGTKFIVTEKLDGQSATYFLERVKGKLKFGVCSRNVNLSNDSNNSSYWAIARDLHIKEILEQLIGDAESIVLQGEIIGEAIQGNKYKIKGYDFYAFNLIIGGEKIHTIKMEEILRDYCIKTVPILENNFTLKDTIADMVEYSKGNSVLLKTKREGVVIRNYDRSISFKVINPDFLLSEK